MRARKQMAVLLTGAALVLASCSTSGEGSAAEPNPFQASTTSTSTTVAPRSTTSTTVPGSTAPTTPAVKPARIPSGYQSLSKSGVGVGLAVPKAWVQIGISGDDLADNADKLAETNPELAELAGQSATLLHDAKVIAARGDGTLGTRPLVAVIQTQLSLPTIPKVMVDQVKQQFERAGGTDVAVKTVSIPGLDRDARALSVVVTLPANGSKQTIRELIVPSSVGLAVIAISADDATADAITSTVGAI